MAACSRRAAARTRRYQIVNSRFLHFIGGSYWVVVLATLWFKRVRFVYSLYGGILSGPASGLKARLRPHLQNLLQRAAATGRIDFTCENEFLYDEIRPLLGAHIHHVPAQLMIRAFSRREEARRELGFAVSGKNPSLLWHAPPGEGLPYRR